MAGMAADIVRWAVLSVVFVAAALVLGCVAALRLH